MGKLTKATPLDVRFWARVDKRGPEDCWPWTGYLNPGGYGMIGRDGGYVNAHRVAYELQVGPIPEGLHIDHLCRVRHCMNARHLEPVTPGENMRRGLAVERRRAVSAAVTHCPQGHEYTPENTRVRHYPKKGWTTRECKACNRERMARKHKARE